MEQDLTIKTFATGVSMKDIYKNINALALQNIDAGTLPYLKDMNAENPLPQDMNVVNGKHLGDINKIQLELKAAKIGAKSLKWIYGADAAILGLELKSSNPRELRDAMKDNPNFDTEPVIGYANTRRNVARLKDGHTNDIAAEGIGMDAQAIYLLDQFTDESIKRVYTPKRIEESLLLRGNDEARRKISIISKNMLKNISEYDTGIREEPVRKAMRENIRKNLARPVDGSENAVRDKIFSVKQEIGRGLNQEQKQLFEQLNTYFTKQQTGLHFTSRLTPEQAAEKKEALKKTFSGLAGKDSPALAELLTDAYLFTDRTTHIGFSYEKIYTKADQLAKVRNISPEAAKFEKEHKAPEILIDNRQVERLRSNARQIKHHTRGM